MAKKISNHDRILSMASESADSATKTSVLRGANEKYLRDAARSFKKAAAQCDFYLSVRSEQGRGGK